MNNIISFWTVSAVTVLSVALALLIEAALLKVVFSCLAHVKAEVGPDDKKMPAAERGAWGVVAVLGDEASPR